MQQYWNFYLFLLKKLTFGVQLKDFISTSKTNYVDRKIFFKGCYCTAKQQILTILTILTLFALIHLC